MTEEAFNAQTSSGTTGQFNCGPSCLISLEKNPAWIDLESCSVRPNLPLHLFLYSVDWKSLRKNQTTLSYKIWLTSGSILVNIWTSIHLGHVLVLFAIFKPGSSGPGFQTWAEKGLRKVQVMYRKDNVFMSFSEISTKYNIPKTHFFKYL